jgi:murein DD-endopeptidase MepM/ murein hydrolase activator NlpD
MGLGEGLLRIGTHALSIVVIVLVVVLLQRLAPRAPINPVLVESAFAAAQPTPTAQVEIRGATPKNIPDFAGIRRFAQFHTNVPTRPRIDVIKYTVQPGDTLFGIAEKFGLQPQTILWGNYAFLFDDPHRLRPGQELNILPVNGTYYQWNEGDGLNGVAEFFGVDPLEIINFPGNHLDPDTIGDFAKPNIAPGTSLIIPGGTRAFTSWQAPFVSRSDPTAARVVGAGYCGTIYGGQVGYGSFIWPTNKHYLSGFNYSPESNHRGIDIAGNEGEPIYAADAGVIVYAGWNDYGYGNMIMIDHGEWQTLYAHLNSINVSCGQGVGRGDVIGALGSTGNSSGAHLHFEMMHITYGKVNPWNFLPAP